MDGQLVQFSVQNHRSLREEQTLSFVTTGPDDPRLLRPAGLAEALVPVTAIFGANASGKSNVLDALSFAQSAVIFSHRAWEPDDGIDREPFAFATDTNAPSQYVIQMMVDGVRYEYGFAVNDDVVIEEWLYSWPMARKQELFTRDKQTFEFSRNLRGENKAIEALTRPNSLFLSAAAQNNHEQLGSVFQWFSNRLRVEILAGTPRPNNPAAFVWSNLTNWWSQFTIDAPERTETHKRRDQVRSLLASADLGIDDFRVEEDKVPVNDRFRIARRISFSHKTTASSGSGSWLPLQQESTGTRTLVRMLPNLLHILETGGVLAIDELNSLHPMLAVAVVRLFQDPRHNPRGAQFLFNTHEASLLGNLLCEVPPLRRDQVWLTEKDGDGASHLYPLTDYKPRSAENLERGYLQGRYGAVPFIGALELRTSTDEESK